MNISARGHWVSGVSPPLTFTRFGTLLEVTHEGALNGAVGVVDHQVVHQERHRTHKPIVSLACHQLFSDSDFDAAVLEVREK